MSALSREDAQKFIRELGIKIGGFTSERRKSIEDKHPDALIAIDSLRKKLAKSTEM